MIMAGRRFWRLTMLSVVGLVVGSAVLISSTLPAAAGVKPKITKIKAVPNSLPSSGGSSTVTAKVTNATSCTLSAVPPVISGTGPVACAGSVTQNVVFPANGTPSTISYKLTLKAVNGSGTKAKKVTVKVAPQTCVFTSPSSTTFTEGLAGSFTVTTACTPTPAMSESGTLPAGVAFIDNGDGTATLSGTPSLGTAGSYAFVITATGPPITQSFTLTVAP
jgi:hypothetical protein